MDKFETRRAALRQLIDTRYGGKAARLAEQLDMQSSYISRLLAPEDNKNRKRLGEDLAREIEDKLELRRGWLDEPTRTMPDGTVIQVPTERGNIKTSPRAIKVWEDGDPLEDDEVEVKRLTLKLSAGTGHLRWEIDEEGTPNRFRADWCKKKGLKPNKLATIMVEGDSMSPAIPDGARMTLNTAVDTVRDGKVHAIDYQDEFFIKRLFKMPNGGVRIVSDNADKNRYPDIVVDPEHEGVWKVLGVPVDLSVDLMGF